MKKRVLAMVLAVVMVCALLPTMALAADSDFVIEDGALKKYTGPGGHVTIPDGVLYIVDGAFRDRTDLTSVTIPDSVTSIEGHAFTGCSGLTSVTLPDSLTYIVWGAFGGCTGLTSVTIPDGVTMIGYDVFSGCTGLTSVTIPDSVTSIEWGTFRGCTGLTSVTIPDSVTEIGSEAFSDCTSLTSITIPDSVTKIGSGAFSGCPKLTEINYGGSEDQWKEIEILSYDNGPLYSAIIHYDSPLAKPAAPAPSVELVSVTGTAYPSTQTVDVDGTKVVFQCYALKDANGNDTNYIKLRDLADILNGSAAQFQVGWDGNITITTAQAYTKNGSEQNTPFSGQRTYEKTAVKTLVDGKETALDTFQLKDDNGGGYTYYKLRDLGKALGITVDWSGERGIFIETK